jgi:putative RNA 2'-phosphotransferase
VPGTSKVPGTFRLSSNGMDKKLVRISNFLSLVLRHKPETIGLSLDRRGWARVDELIAATNRAGVPLDQALLRQVVEQNDKQRFAFSDDGLRIRASQGHSLPVDLGLEPLAPPQFLYHGTATRFLNSIRRHGLIPRGRVHVHLSPDEPTALRVGKRHGKPVVLTVQAGRMHRDGFKFYRSANRVWLTQKVPVEYLMFPPGPADDNENQE